MVCYRHVGCFRDEGPFDYLDTLPAPPETINTTFTLYTRKNPVNGVVIELNNSTSLAESNFEDKQLVKIVIHGFGSTGKNPWVLQMAEALLFAVSFSIHNYAYLLAFPIDCLVFGPLIMTHSSKKPTPLLAFLQT